MKRLTLAFPAAVGIVMFSEGPIALAGCPCQTDVTNDATVNILDAAAVADCANNTTCAACANSCDVDCDGDVDWIDFGAVWCTFRGQTDCCNKP